MDRYETTEKISILGIVANILLLVSKLIIGFISQSQAMIADGFNSAGDVFASVMTFIGNKIASKPEDDTHPYGHGKAEYIFSLIISLSLISVGFTIMRSSILSITRKHFFTFSWWLVMVSLGTIIIKLSLFFYTNSAGKKEDNLLILANSEDHRNDVFISISTLLGIILGTFGIYWVDGVVGVGIALWIIYTACRIFMSSFIVLMDTNMDSSFEEDIKKAILITDGVEHIDSVIAKPVGVRFILIVKVSVSGDMSVNDSHSIAARIRENLRCFKKVEDVVVHINPA